MAVCQAGCKPTQKEGVYRAIEISTGFSRGEWDFTFYKDGKVAFGFLDGKSGVFKYEATLSSDFELGITANTIFTMTQVATGGPLSNCAVGDKLSGIFENKAGFYQITDYMYLALSKPDGQSPADFEAGMKMFEFNLVKCHGEQAKDCDFSASRVPE